MISPIVLSYVIYLINSIVKKKPVNKTLTTMLPILIFVHLVLLSAHVQMGGSHFGNRYPNDALPFVFLGLALLVPKEENKYHNLNYILFLIGFGLNIVGTVGYYCNFFS